MDTLTPEQRSHRMSLIRSKNTQAELRVRRLVYAMGYRYRLHRKDLPGKPDLAFLSIRRVIFVNGCFWHRHQGCRRASIPKSRVAYWKDKFAKTLKRDTKNLTQLKAMGWEYLIIWECELRDTKTLRQKIAEFLSASHSVRR